jgi:hypothetical protein
MMMRIVQSRWNGKGGVLEITCSLCTCRCRGELRLCLAKTSYTSKMSDLAKSWIRTGPIRFLP